MNARKKGAGLIISYACLLLMAGCLSTVSVCLADDHGLGSKQHAMHDAQSEKGVLASLMGKGRDKGDETTGQMVAWSLGAANLTVALSILIRWIKEFVGLPPQTKSGLTRFNTTQKKFLMNFHYISNPLILLVAIVHWSLSKCKSTALPEWGLVIMGVITVLGVVLKFKLCPKSFQRNIYRIHTHPLLLLLLVSLLIIGHMSMD